jgi:hypothetical protein
VEVGGTSTFVTHDVTKVEVRWVKTHLKLKSHTPKERGRLTLRKSAGLSCPGPARAQAGPAGPGQGLGVALLAKGRAWAWPCRPRARPGRGPAGRGQGLGMALLAEGGAMAMALVMAVAVAMVPKILHS